MPDVPTAVLFPGQGSQTPEMRDLVAQREPELLERCLELVGEDPFARVEESTRFQQPAIFCASIAGWRALPTTSSRSAAAGHSLGELAALAAAGVLTVEDALELVVLRGRLMAEADDRGSMIALVGADDDEAAQVAARRRPHRRQRQRARPDRPRGRPRRLRRAPRPSRRRARQARDPPAGRRRVPLALDGARRRAVPRRARRGRAAASRASPSSPAPPREPFEDVREELARALIRPVRWRETFTALHEAGAERFVEVGPGKVLARLAKRIVPGTKVETPAEELRHMPETADRREHAARTAASRRRAPRASSASATSCPTASSPTAPIAERIGVDADWIVRRTGHPRAPLRRARTSAPTDLALAAAAPRAAATPACRPSDIDLVLVATMTPDELTPNTAPLVADALGIGVGAYDVGAACTGWLSALSAGAAPDRDRPRRRACS